MRELMYNIYWPSGRLLTYWHFVHVYAFRGRVNAVLIMLLITDNTNVESRSLSVVKYVINNIMSTALTGRRKMATYLHLVCELLYNIDWPSRRLLTYWHFVYVYEFRARVTYIM